MTDTIFLHEHRPPLSDGSYTLTVTQDVAVDGKLFPAETASRTFLVGGPQYRLPPEDISTVYPPADSIGDHAFVLPHVTLTRSTLPWERSATGDRVSGAPWLAILLLDQDELAQVAIQTVSQTDWDSTARADAKVRVLDADHQFLADRLPQTDAELSLLCHVRQAPHGGETAVVLGGRLPHASDTCHAFLVSVEDCYASGTFQALLKNAKHGTDRLVVLKSWRFTSGDPQQGLLKRLQRLNHTPMLLQSVHTPPAGMELGGASLFAYRMRNGSSAAALYRSPLAPGSTLDPSPAAPTALPTLRSADSLIHYRLGLGLFDVTYAAAWELGRLLALATGSFAQALIRWKHHTKSEALANQSQADASHIAFATQGDQSKPEIPAVIDSFLKKLASLELIPQNYLIPEPDALPPDAIRFFQVDQYWVHCLLEGALSIGRFLANDHQHEAALRQALPSVLDSIPKSGFLLQSDIVSAFPGLVVEGSSGGKVQPMQRRLLGPGLLLCLAATEAETFVLHPAPEELHCGVSNPSTDPKLRMVSLTGSDSGLFASQHIKSVGSVTYELSA